MGKSGKTLAGKVKKEDPNGVVDWFSFVGALYVADNVNYELQSKELFARALKANVPVPTLLRHLKRLEAVELIIRRVQTSDLTVYYGMDITSYFLLSSLEFREIFDTESLMNGHYLSGMEIIEHRWNSLINMASMERGAANKSAWVEIYIDYILKPAMQKFVVAYPMKARTNHIGKETSEDEPDTEDEVKRKYRIFYTVWWTLQHSKKMLEESERDAPTFISEVCRWFREFENVGERGIRKTEEYEYIVKAWQKIEPKE